MTKIRNLQNGGLILVYKNFKHDTLDLIIVQQLKICQEIILGVVNYIRLFIL